MKKKNKIPPPCFSSTSRKQKRSPKWIYLYRNIVFVCHYYHLLPSTWKVRNSIDFDIIFAKCENINFNFLIYGHGKPFINCEDNIEEAAKLILSENYHDELENLKILTEKNERQFMNLSNEMKLLREKLNLIGGEADPEDPEE